MRADEVCSTGRQYPRRAAAVALAPALVVAALAVGCSSESAQEAPAAASSEFTWTATSVDGIYSVTIEPNGERIPIGEFHEWTIGVSDRDGDGVYPARIGIDGGMPGHGHGLPTQPQVTDHLGDGRYRIEGMRFNMAGAWVLEFTVDAPGGRDRVKFDLDLAF